MPASEKSTRPTWIDPDDTPEFTDEGFEKADLHPGEKPAGRILADDTTPHEVMRLHVRILPLAYLTLLPTAFASTRTAYTPGPTQHDYE